MKDNTQKFNTKCVYERMIPLYNTNYEQGKGGRFDNRVGGFFHETESPEEIVTYTVYLKLVRQLKLL
jgi:hypothetical protein